MAAMDRGASDPEVQRWVAAYHDQINRRYYTCRTEIYRQLGNMYVADPRFMAFYEKVRPGLAVFMRDANERVLRRGRGA